jgi:hypothetical protein
LYGYLQISVCWGDCLVNKPHASDGTLPSSFIKKLPQVFDTHLSQLQTGWGMVSQTILNEQQQQMNHEINLPGHIFPHTSHTDIADICFTAIELQQLAV